MKTSSALLLGLATAPVALTKRNDGAPVANHERAGQIRAAFQSAWGKYSANAFGHDTWGPVSNTAQDNKYVLCIYTP